EYAVVMGHQQDRAPIPLGQLMEALDDFAPRPLVERRRRLVGEDDTRAPGERASDGDALLLPGGELVRVFTPVLFEADATHDLARLHFQRDAEENLLAERAAAEVMAHPVEGDERLGRHQKISAGSAARSLRIATAPDAAHMTAVKPRTRTPRSAVSCIGSMVADCVMA